MNPTGVASDSPVHTIKIC